MHGTEVRDVIDNSIGAFRFCFENYQIVLFDYLYYRMLFKEVRRISLREFIIYD